MNSDFRLDVDFLSHPKIKKLRRRLGEAAVLGWVGMLAFTAKRKSNGRLVNCTAEDIALAAVYDGDSAEWIKAMRELRLLDQSRSVLVVHDWTENNPYAAGHAERSAHARKAALARHDKRRRTLEDSDAPSTTEQCGEHKGAVPEIEAVGLSTAPSPDPVPFPFPEPDPKEDHAPNGKVAGSAPTAWIDDSSHWLRDFLLTEQHAINGKKIPYLIDSDWWADLSEAVNGLTIEFVRIEFAKMAVWFRNNPKKLPTEKGVRRFVANWFQTAAEDRRRQVTSYAQSARR